MVPQNWPQAPDELDGDYGRLNLLQNSHCCPHALLWLTRLQVQRWPNDVC